MKIAEVKKHYQGGLLSGFSSTKDEASGKWILVIKSVIGNTVVLQSSRGEDKLFASLAALNAEVQEITGKPVKSIDLNAD